MTKLIGIAGKARTGKDTMATHLWEAYGFTRVAFADPMKNAAQHIFGLSHEATWSDALKETTIPYWGLSPRQMFQLLGTEAVKPIFGNDLWVKRWNITYQSLKESDDVVVPDVRHEDEAAYIRSLGGVIVHLVRDSAPVVNAHSSENGVLHQYGDIVIHNTGTLEDYKHSIDKMFGTL